MILLWHVIHKPNVFARKARHFVGVDMSLFMPYDRKESSGGSWWERKGPKRDLHAHCIVFNNPFVNTNSLFEEMGISWNDMLQPADARVYTTVFKYQVLS